MLFNIKKKHIMIYRVITTKLLIVIFATVQLGSLMAQGNLIPNPGFEIKSCCPTKNTPQLTYFGAKDIPCLFAWVLPENGFSTCSVGTADYYNTCSTFAQTQGYGTPRTGDGFAGIAFGKFREYITTSLVSNLL
jgi:hypothetical protein